MAGDVLALHALGFELEFGEYPFCVNILILIFDFNCTNFLPHGNIICKFILNLSLFLTVGCMSGDYCCYEHQD